MVNDLIRQPPHSVEAEQSLLGALLLDNRAWEKIADVVSVGDLYRDDHRRIFRHIGKLIEGGQPADVVTVLESIEGSEDKDKTGGIVYLGSLSQNTPSAQNIRRYAEVVRERSDLRVIAEMGEELARAALSPTAEVGEVFGRVESSLTALRGRLVEQGSGCLDLVALAQREPSPPGSILDGLPIGYCTLLAGHGGAGKSAIALYLAVCIASGFPFFGLSVARRKVRVLSCEDREDVLHWRLSRICAHLGLELTDLVGQLGVEDLVGRDSIMWRADGRASSGVTPAYRRLADRMRQSASEVLFVDGINDTFAGNENDRGHVKSYVNSMLALIPPQSGALVLIGHVSKTSANGIGAEGYSGSTGWHNSSRARWYLRPETKDRDEGAEKSGALLLDLQKSNHGDSTSIRFTWSPDAQLFVGELIGSTSRIDRVLEEKAERAGILAAFLACAEAAPPIHVPAAMTGPRTAFHVLSQRPELPDSLRSSKSGKARFWRVIEGLRHMNAIAESSYMRAHRKRTASLTLTTEGVRQCAESK